MKNSDYNKRRKVRDMLRMCTSLLFCWLYIPHFLCFIFIDGRSRYRILEDVRKNSRAWNLDFTLYINFIYLLHCNGYFRSLYYYRIGPTKKILISWLRKGDPYFTISPTSDIGEGMLLVHPYATVINADSVGSNLSINSCTTIGSKYGMDDRPTIGNNVKLGTNVLIIGKINIGDNVTIGAGSVVVKDIPENCVVAGNPAKIIRFL